MKTKPFLIFDLDGTISDPIDGIWRSINFALEYFGYDPCPEEAINNCIGPPLDESFVSLTGERSSEKAQEFVRKYRERFARVGYSENRLYPGITESLMSLAKQGFPLGICTSKRADFAEKIVKMFQLSDYFEFISGGDVGIKKSQQIKSLLLDNRIDKRSLMIGDRYVDLRAAHENGINSVGVLWGYGSREELEAESPNYLLAHPQDLKNFLKSDN